MRLAVPLVLVLSLIVAGVAIGENEAGHLRPKSVTAECFTTSATVSWEPVAELGLSGYNVYKKPSGEITLMKVNAELITTASYVAESLSTGRSYDFGVEAVYDDGHHSDMSSLASCTTT